MSTRDQIRAQFQEQLDCILDDETLHLDLPRERPGPVVVRGRIVVDGQGCTVWAMAGPVLSVQANNVALKNLRVEHTADGSDQGPHAGVALHVGGTGLSLDNVTVRGAVVGLKAEEGQWRYPHQLNLGALAHGMSHTLRLRLVVPVPCQLTSDIAGVQLVPRTLTPGAHEVRLDIEQMLKDTLVFGTIGIKTAFLRREIVLNAHVLTPTEGLPAPATAQERVVWQPSDWDALVNGGLIPTAAPEPAPITSAPIRPTLPPPVAAPVAPTPLPAAALPTPVHQPPVASVPYQPAPPPTSMPVFPTSTPSSTVRDPTRKKVSGPLLGSLFTSPPIAQTPPPPESVPPDVGSTPMPKKTKSVPLRPASGLFAPKEEVPPPAVEPPPLPEPVVETPPVVSPEPNPPSTPLKKKFKPIGGFPAWVPKPPTDG